MSTQSRISEILEQLQAVANESPEARSASIDALRDLQLKLETPHDANYRLTNSFIEVTIARVAEDLRLYQTLSESDQPLTVAELSAKTGAAPLLLSRILRYLASVRHIQETARDTFTANHLTKALAIPKYRGNIYHIFDNISFVMQVLPDFLAETNYRDVDDSAKTAAQKAFGTDLPTLMYFPTQPKRFEALQQAMVAAPLPATQWFEAFPFEKELGDFAGPLAFVDVGGGFGHRSVALLDAFPEKLRGRILLQDLPQTLDHMPPLEGIPFDAHDFFQPQSVKSPKFFYMRNVLHDWPDDKALVILKHLKDALGPESQILVNEIVMPNSGVHWHATSFDMIMMSALGSRERTEADWHALFDAAGLKIKQIYTYFPRQQESIIQVVPK